MDYPSLKRNRYYDEESGYEYDSSERNYFQDFVGFHLPLIRLQQARYAWGIARGMEVQGGPGDHSITVQPGVAMDGLGNLMVLSSNGSGCAWDLATEEYTEIRVTAGGLQLPIAAAWPSNKALYLLIEPYELLRSDEGSGGRLEQVPKLYAIPTSQIDQSEELDGRVILGIMTLDADHKLASLEDCRDGCKYHRRMLGERLGSIELQRTARTDGGTLIVETVGTLEPDRSIGLRVETSRLNLTGDLSIAGTAEVQGDFDLGGTLKSSVGTVAIASPATLLSTLVVDGNVGIGKSDAPASLTVFGKTDLANSLTVQGAANLQSALTVTGATRLQGTLSVAGAADLTSSLTVKSTTTLQAGLTVAGHVGIGTLDPQARLSVVTSGADQIVGTAQSSTFRTSAGKLSSKVMSELSLASIGFLAQNNMSLGVRALRFASGNDWRSAAIGLGLDVDNTPRAGGASLWLHPNGNVGIGTSSPEQRLHIAGSFLRVDGAGNEQAYIGGDGYGRDVQVGSFHTDVSQVSLYNPTAKAGMSLSANDVIMTGNLLRGGKKALHIVGIQQSFSSEDSSDTWKSADCFGECSDNRVSVYARAWDPFRKRWGYSCISFYVE